MKKMTGIPFEDKMKDLTPTLAHQIEKVLAIGRYWIQAMNDEIVALENSEIQGRIFTIRGLQVMLDRGTLRDVHKKGGTLRDVHKKVNNYLLSMGRLAAHQFIS
jgi:hypothetical protein